MRRTRNYLTHIQAAKMVAELREMKEEIETKKLSATDTATVLTRRCGFLVTKGNIWTAAAELGIRFQKQILRDKREAAKPTPAEGPGVEAALGSLLMRVEELAKQPGLQNNNIEALTNSLCDVARRLESLEADHFALYQHLKSLSTDLGRPLPG